MQIAEVQYKQYLSFESKPFVARKWKLPYPRDP